MAAESTQLRLDAAWKAAEHETNNNIMKTSSQLLHDDVGNDRSKSSLEYDASAPPPSQLNGSDDTTLYYEDPFLLPSNDTSPTSLSSSSSLTQQHHSSSLQLQQQHDDQTSTPPTLLTQYKTLLQNHSSILTLIEMIMERFIFYGHLFKSHHHDNDCEERGILKMEMYYATWNVIRWINEVVLLGVGGGIGLTVGSRGEWLLLCDNGSNDNSKNIRNTLSLNQWIASKLHKLIPIIRATLTATTCIYPAVEAFSSRRSIRLNHQVGNEWEKGRYRAAVASYRLERVRFMGRVCLLMISWWARLQRSRHHQQQQQQQQQQSMNENNYSVIPTVLQRGGELDRHEELVPLQHAEDEARIVQYVGRRTGRRSISSISSPSSFNPPQGLVYSTLSKNIPLITKATNLIEWISKQLLTSSTKKLAYVYAIGEILHIVRPLYWSRAQCSEWRGKRFLSPQQQQQQRGGVNSWSIWKAWWVSLFMDLISDRLLRLTASGGGEGGDIIGRNSRHGNVQRRSSFPRGRHGGRQQQQQPPPAQPQQYPTSAEEAKLTELEWRRSRHKLYLLRSPMYDAVTRPVASFIARVVSMIPSMGIGRWAAEYVLDVMSYWNDNHFMLES